MKRSLTQKIGWPVFAVAVAFSLWVTFVGSPEVVTFISVPVAYENMPVDYEPAGDLPDRISVETRGPAARLHVADSSNAAVVLDFDRVHSAGEYTFTIGRRDLSLPAGVRIVGTVPTQIRVRFERQVRAAVPVKVRFLTPPPEGYRIAAEQVHPGKLTIVGPESRVRQVGYVETDPVDLSRVVGKQEFRVNTFLGDPKVRFVTSPVVQVSVTLAKTPQGGTASHGQATVRN